MSEPVAHPPAVAAPAVVDSEVPPYHEIDFDKQEVKQFNQDDGQAVSVIGKMLVMFFLYSLIVMLAVAYWTSRTFTFNADLPLESKTQEAAKPAH